MASIDHLRPGSAVSAANLSGPDRQLAALMEALRARVESASMGEALFRYDAPCAVDAPVGTPVAWDADAGQYVPALAEADGAGDVTSRGCVYGLVFKRGSGPTATLLVAGAAPLDLTAAGVAAPEAGVVYHLSPLNPGKLVAGRAAPAVPVLRYSADGYVHIANGRADPDAMPPHAEAGVVTSLVAGDSGRVTITNCDGDPADRGDLKVDVSLNLATVDGTDAAAKALKSVNEDGALVTGPVLSTLTVGAGLTLTGGEAGDGGARYGDLTLALANVGGEVELPLDLSKVNNARITDDGTAFYFEFPAGQDSTLRSSVRIPDGWAAATPQVRLRLHCLAPAGGTFPALTATIARIPSPGTAATASAPVSATPALDTTRPSTAVGDHFEAFTAATPTAAGELLFVTIARDGSSDAAGDVGLLSLSALLS